MYGPGFLRRRRIHLALLGALALLALGLWQHLGDRGREGSGLADGAALVQGAAIYREACASCHGAELEGQPDWREPGPDGRLPAPPHDATGHTWHHPDRLLFRITQLGTAAVIGGGYESDMPGFGEVYSEAEIKAVLAWIKSQWPDRQRDYQAQVTAADEVAR